MNQDFALDNGKWINEYLYTSHVVSIFKVNYWFLNWFTCPYILVLFTIMCSLEFVPVMKDCEKERKRRQRARHRSNLANGKTKSPKKRKQFPRRETKIASVNPSEIIFGYWNVNGFDFQASFQLSVYSICSRFG